MGLRSWKEKAEKLRTNVYTLYLAFKDRRTPWYTKAFLILIVAYVLSPIDLIPDFIPVVGYLDDVVLVAGGIYLATKMVPGEVLAECRQKAVSERLSIRARWIAAAVVIFVWLLVIYLIVKAIWID